MKLKLIILLILTALISCRVQGKYQFHTKISEKQMEVLVNIYERAPLYQIDPDFAVNLAFAESSLRTGVVSRESRGRKSVGPMQVLISTGKGMGYTYDEICDPIMNIGIGLEYLRVIKYDFYGWEINDVAVAATYNHGIGNMLRRIREGPILYKDLPSRTQKYLNNIFRREFEENFVVLEGRR